QDCRKASPKNRRGEEIRTGSCPCRWTLGRRPPVQEFIPAISGRRRRTDRQFLRRMSMHLGAAWYPEHWPEARWPEDVRLMTETGFTGARIAGFAWSTMEPMESHYEFEWLERAVSLLHETGLAVVLGTPTAAPPAWLTYHHPDTVAVEPNGRPAQHGNR